MKSYQAGDFKAAKYAEKVVIHLNFNGRHFTLPDGGPFDLLKEGAPVELRVPAVFLNHRASDLGLNRIEVRELLPAGAMIFARVDLRGIEEAFYNSYSHPSEQLLDFARRAKYLMERHTYIDHGTVQPRDGLVRLELKEPLVMYRTGQKTFKLDRCSCVIWGLHERPTFAHSLNQALTQISEFAEIARASHTGNAFLRCLVALGDPLNPEPQVALAKLAVLRNR